jgi:hypothetical protein
MNIVLQKLRDIVTDPQYKRMYEIGAMASIASHIEHLIETILLGLIETDERYGGAVIRWVSVQQQIILIKKILKDRYGEDSETYKELSDSINQLSKSIGDRNDILHSAYKVFGNGKTFSESYKRGKFEVTKTALDADAVEANVNLAYERFYRADSLAWKHNVPSPSPSLGKLPQETPEDSRTEDQNPDK